MNRHSRAHSMRKALSLLGLSLLGAIPMTVLATDDIKTRLALLRHLDDRARVIALLGDPDSERTDTFMGLNCSVLHFEEKHLLTLSVETAEVRLCGVAGVSVLTSTTYQTRSLLP